MERGNYIMNQAIILAAGEGSRMKSSLIKVLHKINGKVMLKYVLDACKGAGFDKSYLIVGNNKDKVMEEFSSDTSISFIEQKMGPGEPYGTGYAASLAKEHVNAGDNVLVIFGDTPLVDEEVLKDFLKYHEDNDNNMTILSAVLDDCEGYGRIVRDADKNLTKIVEQKDASDDELKINEVNSGIYCFKGEDFLDAINNLKNDNVKKEYYLTDAVSYLLSKGKKVNAYISDDQNIALGVNNQLDLSKIEEIVRKKIIAKWMLEGVYFKNPSNVYIEENVRIGRDVEIYPDVILEGDTIIEDNVKIYGYTRIVNSHIAKDVTIESSLIEESFIGERTKVGPNAHLRPNSKIGKDCKVGNFVEIKNASLGDGTKAGHLAYVGDADVGRNVNIGCGVIFANYDGKDKFRSKVEDNAFIGSNSNLVAPVEIGENAYVAAGSTIITKVMKDSLSIARARQVDKIDWVKNKKNMEEEKWIHF